MLRRPSSTPTLLILALFAAISCGPKAGGRGPGADVGAYPALRWAPADVTYGALVTRVDGAIRAARDLVEAIGIMADADPAEVGEALRRFLGIDVLSVDDLSAAGVDVAAGGVVFSQGLSPTLVFALSDPAAMQNRIDSQRERAGSGAAIGVAVRDNVEIYTALGDRDLHTHWAIDGAWMWVHFEIVDEHERELGWFEASRAAKGALAKDPDFTWARGQAEATQPGAPLTALIRPHRLAMRFATAVDKPEATACMNLMSPPRAALAMGATAEVAEGNVILDLAGRGTAVGALTLPVPGGWSAARGQPAVGFEWNLDLAALAAWIVPCTREPQEALAELGVRTIRGFLTSFDPSNFSGRGAVSAELTSRAWIDRRIDITGRSMFESKRKFGPLDGKRLAFPTAPEVDYVLTDTLAMAAVGDGLLAQVVGDGKPVPGALAALEVRPAALSPEAWHLALQYLGGVSRAEARERTIRRVNQWKHATIELTRDGELLRFRARGERP